MNNYIILNRGKVLGGSSAINGMVYIRDHCWKYDHGAEPGNEFHNYQAPISDQRKNHKEIHNG